MNHFFFCIDKYFVWNKYWNLNLYIVVKPYMLSGLNNIKRNGYEKSAVAMYSYFA